MSNASASKTNSLLPASGVTGNTGISLSSSIGTGVHRPVRLAPDRDCLEDFFEASNDVAGDR